jgi:hypothetical protein
VKRPSRSPISPTLAPAFGEVGFHQAGVVSRDPQPGAGDRVLPRRSRAAGQSKKVRSAAGRGDAVAVEQVIGRDVVLVHRLLDQPHAHHLRVEPQIARRVGGDRGEMMDAGELHVAPLDQDGSGRQSGRRSHRPACGVR